MLFGWTGFTTMEGSSVSSVGQVPKVLNPVLHVPTALGRERSTSGPLTVASADASGCVDGAVGVVRSTQPTTKPSSAAVIVGIFMASSVMERCQIETDVGGRITQKTNGLRPRHSLAPRPREKRVWGST